jgi:hypothetical protein
MSPYTVPYQLKPDEQLFFLHIPKTAGTTLISLIDQHFFSEEICPEQLQSKVKKITASDLANFRLFRGHLDYDLYKLLPKKPLYLTMLRDPLERVVSLYEFWKRNSEGWVANYPIYEEIFREANDSDLFHFVCTHNDSIRMEIENNQTRRIVANTRDPLDSYTSQEVLEIAKKRIAEEFLFFGLVEKFDESLQLLCYSLGWLPIQSYQKKMVAPTPNKVDNLPTKTREAILERNQLDIALYEFAWNLFQERYQAMLYQLIERSYQDHFNQVNLPMDRLEVFKSRPIQGMGWYPREFDPDGKIFYWMGPNNEAFIDVSIPRNCNLTITINIGYAIHSCLLTAFQFYVNGIEVPLNKISGDEYHGIYQGVITQHMVEVNSSLTRLTVRVDRTFSPHELDPNSLDTRQLSLSFREITIEAIPPNSPVVEKKESGPVLKLVSKILRLK